MSSEPTTVLDPVTVAVAPPPLAPATTDRSQPDLGPSTEPTQLPGSRDPGDGTTVDRHRWVLRPTLIFLASRVVTWTTMAIAAVVTHRSILQEVDRWDSKWFLKAAGTGWPRHLPYEHGHVVYDTIAFFPLFPLCIRGLNHLTGLSLLGSGIVVTSVTGLTAMIAVWVLVRHYADQGSADRATLLLAFFPGSFVLSLVYSEGIVITLLALGLLALITRRWLLAGVLGLLASAASPIALAFEVSCLWCAYRALHDDRDWRSLAAPVLAPLGFVAYQLWLWGHTGNLAAWRLTERQAWKSYPSVAFAVHTVWVFLSDPVATNKTQDLLFAGTVLTVFAAVVALRSRMPVPMLVYGLSAAVLGLVSAPIGLRPRFIFLAFPLVVAVGTWLRGRNYLTVLSASTALLIWLTFYEVCSLRIFP